MDPGSGTGTVGFGVSGKLPPSVPVGIGATGQLSPSAHTGRVPGSSHTSRVPGSGHALGSPTESVKGGGSWLPISLQ
jgi:hypothetical protein